MWKTFRLLLTGLAVAAPLHGQQGLLGDQPPGEELLDRVAAVVGDTVLLVSDVQTEVARLTGAGQLPQDSTELEAAVERIIDDQINNLVLIEAAREAGVTVSEEMINQEVDEQVRTIQQQFGSEPALVAALAREGLTLEEYRRNWANSVRDQQMVGEFVRMRLGSRARPVIDEDEIREFYEAERERNPVQRPATVGYRQVVIAPEPSEESRRAAIEQAEEVLAELQSGGDFEVLARRFSDDPGSREHGGDLGWFSTGRMVPAFERVAYSLRPGQTSGLVETELGFHIIRLERARGPERHARHILIQPEIDDADLDQARERADSVATAVRDDATPIATLAGRYNADEYRANVPGAAVDDLAAQYGDEFGQALAAAAAGDIVGPLRLEDPRGDRWAVLQVTEHREAGDYTLNDLRDIIRQELEQQKMIEQLLIELREQIFVDTFL